MGHKFQAECWEKYLSGHHLLFIMAKGKLAKESEKALKRKNELLAFILCK